MQFTGKKEYKEYIEIETDDVTIEFKMSKEKYSELDKITATDKEGKEMLLIKINQTP